jgi:transposase-like protein
MSNDTVVSLAAPARVCDPLTELLRTGARRLIEAAVSAEFEEYLSAFVDEKLLDGRQRVVRNGHLPERRILTGVGEVDVRVPKARSPRVRPGGSVLRWCRLAFGAARASMRRFRGCTCTGFRAANSRAAA